jgi:signal transduction histidine kinase
VQLIIEDNGIGIKQEYLPYVTDKFFRVPDIKRTGVIGFGMGLSYVKQIIEAHGGKLKITSEEGKGTKIMITLSKTNVDA